ncbi:MAG: dehydrogenase [Oligoflexales bacterium]|nr:dehydrogenase [Oligoflexales bacterium]
MAETLSEYTKNLFFADPVFHWGIPHYLQGLDELSDYVSRFAPLLRLKTFAKTSQNVCILPKWARMHPRFQQVEQAEIIVSTATLAERFDYGAFKNKILLLDHVPAHLSKQLKRAGVQEILCFLPDQPFVDSPTSLSYGIWEALLQLGKEGDQDIESDDVLDLIEDAKLKPRMHTLHRHSVKPGRKFAFIVHPLSVNDFFRHPLLSPVKGIVGPFNGLIEQGLKKLPGRPYGRIQGVMSEKDGQRVEGLVYTLFDTPKQLLASKPEDVYKKLIKLCERAKEDGAQIIGLGAFTKVVGDAGVTVASESPIPVTTGNSLSASASLWAAKVACKKMGILERKTPDKKYRATAMIVGATGSIGAVSAKLLSNVVDRLILTAPRPNKLLEIKDEITALSPDVSIKIATNNNKYLSESDLIVISTSAPNGNVFDLQKVKPGAVICDVSRPLSFSAEQAASRPDVLIVESGEVILPGDYSVTCDLGLEDNIVYACLAETALLALDGRMENYTLSRTIDFEKVSEIYEIARVHGAKLAAIRGPNGIITDQEILLCSEHAAIKKNSVNIQRPTFERVMHEQ